MSETTMEDKVYILDAFKEGAVSSELLFDILNAQASFLGKLKFAMEHSGDDAEQWPLAVSVMEDLCELFEKDADEYWEKGNEERKATGGNVNIEELRKQGIPNLIEGSIECGIVGLNPARVLWDAIHKVRGAKP